MSSAESAPDKDCYTLPNGECVAADCSLHGPLQSADTATQSRSWPWHPSPDCATDPRLVDWHETMMWLDAVGAPRVQGDTIMGRLLAWDVVQLNDGSGVTDG